MPSTNSDKAREALTAAFDAISAWRTEVEKTNEKSTAMVIEKVGEAAGALGWPKQIVDATRLQMQTIGKMQLQTIDSMMNTWREQIKSPSQASALLSKLSSMVQFRRWGQREHESLRDVYAIRGAVAASMERRVGSLVWHWQRNDYIADSAVFALVGQ